MYLSVCLSCVCLNMCVKVKGQFWGLWFSLSSQMSSQILRLANIFTSRVISLIRLFHSPPILMYPALLKILSINNHCISGRSWADNHYQYTRTSKLPSCIDYQNQKATIKPNEIFIQCFEKGEVA